MDNKEDEINLEEMAKSVEEIRHKIAPYSRIIMILCIILMAFILMFLGFAYGSYSVCSQVEGFLDNKFTCHPDYNQQGLPKNYTPPGTIEQGGFVLG